MGNVSDVHFFGMFGYRHHQFKHNRGDSTFSYTVVRRTMGVAFPFHLLQVVALHQPCVVFLRDVESVCFGNAERFLAFKKCTEQVTTPCVFIGRSIKQVSPPTSSNS